MITSPCYSVPYRNVTPHIVVSDHCSEHSSAPESECDDGVCPVHLAIQEPGHSDGGGGDDDVHGDGDDDDDGDGDDNDNDDDDVTWPL